MSAPTTGVSTPRPAMSDEVMANPWPALWALVLGFFMIMVDVSIVSVATPSIIEGLDAEVNKVVWVTSAYLLSYGVPVLITGRLGDRFGPRRIYLIGMVIFTVSSLWCGLASSVDSLIAARVAQGLGAALMTPQTMAVITRIFPPERRGSAMALWGATAGIATLLGPLLGGLLVDTLGWEWIFFVNVPVGVLAFFLALRLVPQLTPHGATFDWAGVALSGLGLFLLVFGVQEGNTYDWGHIWGPFSVWMLIGVGLVLLGVFVWWQSRTKTSPLMPLELFKDRNFSLSNASIALVGFAFTGMSLALMLYAQTARGMSPLQAGSLMIPLAIPSIVLARTIGRLTDSRHPRTLVLFGFGAVAVGVLLLSQFMKPDSSLTVIVLALLLVGAGSGCLWGPLSTTANRNLPRHQAGAGAGVYNTTRQMGSVLGSATAALLIDMRLRAYGLPTTGGEDGIRSGERLPDAIAGPFAEAMSQVILLVPVAFALGLVLALFFERPHHLTKVPAQPAA